jgi:hypothetical protein
MPTSHPPPHDPGVQAAFLNQSRLGIPVTFVEETLHGGMDDGTIFPMPCGMGSTWDAPLVAEIGAAIALEARAGGVDRAFSPELQVRVMRVYVRVHVYVNVCVCMFVACHWLRVMFVCCVVRKRGAEWP